MNYFDALTTALNEARTVNRVVADNANAVARLLVGNLSHVSDNIVKQLKDELRHYNAHTKTWRP